MSTSYALLGILGRRPSYGYDLKRGYDTLYGREKPLAFGQVYATLSRLLRDQKISEQGTRQGGGPERKLYAITDVGRNDVEAWLATPEDVHPNAQTVLFINVVTAILLDKLPDEYLDTQRASHLDRMRGLTKTRRQGDLAQALRADYALFHLEADLRWIDLTVARLGRLNRRYGMPVRGSIIEALNVAKAFGATPALRGASLDVAPGEILAIMGPSGSGKSTLLHCLAGVFTPDSGEIWFDGRRLDTLDKAARTVLRRTAFGFVFQFGQLVPELTAADNVALPLLFNNAGRKKAYQVAESWLYRLDLDGFEEHRTGELSGGQAQRVALARALAVRPRVIFADEPTGSLDSLAGEKVMDMLVDLVRAEGTTVVLVTHDPRVAAYADRATPRQINVIASADAAVSAFAGTILGISLFQSLRPTLADVAVSGARFFPETVTPTFEGYVAIVVFVPLAAAAAAMVSLRRVRVSPLAARTRVTPASPAWWRVLPLPVGIAVFAAALTSWPRSGTSGGPNPGLLFAGTLLIMGGLISGGTWLTGQAAHLMARHGRAASSLLAARRLADNPRAAFRSVSGLVLAVFVGSGIALLAPTVQAVQSGAGGDVTAGFNTVLRVPVGEHLSARGAADLMSSLGTFPGVALLPLYALEQGGGVETPTGEFVGPGPRTAVKCSRLEQFPALGTCPPGATGASVDPDAIQALLTDNPLYLYKALPVVDATSPPVATDLTGSTLAILLVKTNDADILERVRTFLTTYGAQTSTLPGGGRALSAWQMGTLEPETFGEIAQTRNNVVDNVEGVVMAVLGITLLIAGCSLAVTVGGGLVERKRPFTLLRVSGAPMSTLFKVVVQESALPLASAAVFAATSGLIVAALLTRALIPAGAHLVLPGRTYYLSMGAGLAVSLLVTSATLPPLARLTEPSTARFE